MEYVTEDKARLIMVNMLKEYEREVILPRHAETQDALSEIKALVNKGKGAAFLASGLVGLASVIWIVIQIKGALH